MKKRSPHWLRFVMHEGWGRLPGPLQLVLSQAMASLFHASFSRHFVPLYRLWHYPSSYDFERFAPASGPDSYRSFQDFFARRLRRPLKPTTPSVWPCEGWLCESSPVSALRNLCVKGQVRRLDTIFGLEQKRLPPHAHYSNVFLHNSHYHRIHAPTTAKIVRIKRIAGKLQFLRPWIYGDKPSTPALLNERVNLELSTAKKESWFLSLVGGPLVGTVRLAPHVREGSTVKVGEEIAYFALGSTCCLLSPEGPSASVGTHLQAGDPFNISPPVRNNPR